MPIPFRDTQPALRTGLAVILSMVLAAGCAGVPETPPGATAQQLDLAALKTRLREADSIGVFTKVALRNQVDDLLQKFRAHHQGGRQSAVAVLRQPYNMLILKLLALVQDRDPALARSISGSREAIWSMLADPEQFNALI